LKKDELRRKILQHLHDEELLSEDEGDELETDRTTLELKKLEFQENERARENALRMKELELKERELAMKVKLKEMELAATPTVTKTAPSTSSGFDISKHICFVPPFQEHEVDKYFLHFEKVATSLEWPKDVWTLLLQSVLVGKAREVYSALSLDQSSEYEVVKTSVLNAYELVPEAYRQKFRESRKDEAQTYVFAREKERLFDRWCASMEIGKDFAKL